MGYDLCAFSGGKAMRGPQCAGLLSARENSSPTRCSTTVRTRIRWGRVAKVGKEEIMA
jgi:L-seryl-tRNA(Ser) seleniumtransferase